MDPITLTLIMAGTGLAKGMLDQQEAEKKRKMAATTAQWSPWTSLSPQMPNSVNPLGSVIEGALTGAIMGQAMNKPKVDITSQAADGSGSVIQPEVPDESFSTWYAKNFGK